MVIDESKVALNGRWFFRRAQAAQPGVQRALRVSSSRCEVGMILSSDSGSEVIGDPH